MELFRWLANAVRAALRKKSWNLGGAVARLGRDREASCFVVLFLFGGSRKRIGNNFPIWGRGEDLIEGNAHLYYISPEEAPSHPHHT
jgi:hypothetical protein